jgi:hypothetical protein
MVRSAVSIRNYFIANNIKNAYICIMYVRELSEEIVEDKFKSSIPFTEGTRIGGFRMSPQVV